MKKVLLPICILFLSTFFNIATVRAEKNSLTFTITPPLVKNNMSPGEEFVSAIKVVNNNEREETFCARVENFKSTENSQVEFIDDGDDPGLYTLKQWIKIPQRCVDIGPFSSKNIPYIIEAPEDASPGGHYAGILIGTAPADVKKEGAMIGVSSVISSLIFINIEGDIVEKGYIRQFSTNKTFVNGDKVEFDVRFENTGNVHLKPVGDIKIYNIFGKEKGYIPVNHRTDFGNVLPESERRWRFEWETDEDLVLANRYKAVLTLGFGDEAKQADYREVFFWLINIKLLLIIAGSVIIFFALLIFFIKMYVGQSVKRVQKQIEMQKQRREAPLRDRGSKDKKPERKVVDLRHRKR